MGTDFIVPTVEAVLPATWLGRLPARALFFDLLFKEESVNKGYKCLEVVNRYGGVGSHLHS